MKEERYSIIFSSKTGNTAELANAIRDALPQENCDYFGTSEIEEPVSEMLYIGFWTDQGNADKSALECTTNRSVSENYNWYKRRDGDAF